MLAFIEHNFGLPPLTNRDAPAYDYQYSFDFTAPPSLAKTHLTHSPIPVGNPLDQEAPCRPRRPQPSRSSITDRPCQRADTWLRYAASE